MHSFRSPPVAEHLDRLAILRLAHSGVLPKGWERRWLASELHCQDAEIAAFCAMGARFAGDDPAVAFVIDVVNALLGGRQAWDAAAASIGATRAELAADPTPQAHQFTGLVSWLALHGTPGEVALVVHDDWLLYCAACAELGTLLTGATDTPPAVVDYLNAYGSPPGHVIGAAADLVMESLARPAEAPLVHRSQPLVALSLSAFWNGVAEG